jgi:TonB family protein
MEHSQFSSSKNKLLRFLLFSILLHGVLFLAVREIETVDEIRSKKDEDRITVRIFRSRTSAKEAVSEEKSGLADRKESTGAKSVVPKETETVESRPAPEKIEPIEETAENNIESKQAHAPDNQEKQAREDRGKEEPVVLGKITTLGPVAGGEDTKNYGEEAETTRPSAGNAEMVPFDALGEGSRTPKPEYPQLARRWGHEGLAILRITVGEDGAVLDADLLQSTGYRELDEAALEVVRRRWKFKAPGKKIMTIKEFEFRLRR